MKMETIIIVQGKNLKDISSINRRLITLLGSLRTTSTNFIATCIYEDTLSEKEKDNLSNEFGDNFVFSFIEFDSDAKNEKTYIDVKHKTL